MALGEGFAERQPDADPPARNLVQFGAQVVHQALAGEAVADDSLDLGIERQGWGGLGHRSKVPLQWRGG